MGQLADKGCSLIKSTNAIAGYNAERQQGRLFKVRAGINLLPGAMFSIRFSRENRHFKRSTTGTDCFLQYTEYTVLKRVQFIQFV